MTPFNFLLELEFLKHQQILQILRHCVVLVLFNVNMPSCPSPWRSLLGGGRVLDQYLGMAISSILLPCLGQTTKSTLSCFKAIYCMTKLLQDIKFMLQSLIYFWNLGANFIKQIKSIMYCMQYPVYNWGQTCTKLYTLFRTNVCEIVYPVWDRGQKPSLHRPYKGLHPQVPKQHLQKFWKFIPWGV